MGANIISLGNSRVTKAFHRLLHRIIDGHPPKHAISKRQFRDLFKKDQPIKVIKRRKPKVEPQPAKNFTYFLELFSILPN